MTFSPPDWLRAAIGAAQRFACRMDRPSGQQRLGIVPVNHEFLFHPSSPFVLRRCRCAAVMTRHLTAGLAAILLAAPAGASPNPWPNGVPTAPAAPQGGVHGGGGFHGGHGFRGGGFFFVPETEVVHDVVVVHDQPTAAPEPPPPPPAPREPYVIGRTYGSLPGGCMKMVEGLGEASYFHCSEGWYRQVGAQFRAVAGP
jgi:hypothetical protein